MFISQNNIFSFFIIIFNNSSINQNKIIVHNYSSNNINIENLEIKDSNNININISNQNTKKKSQIPFNKKQSSKEKDTKNQNILQKFSIKQEEKNSKSPKKKRNKDKDKREDYYGEQIKHKGKQKITFIDQISNNRLVDVVKIASYKEYNVMEDNVGKDSDSSGCCNVF